MQNICQTINKRVFYENKSQVIKKYLCLVKYLYMLMTSGLYNK